MNGDLSGAGFSAAIRIVPRPSPRLRRALIGLHLGIMGLGWVALADPWAVLTLGLASGVPTNQRVRARMRRADRLACFCRLGNSTASLTVWLPLPVMPRPVMVAT